MTVEMDIKNECIERRWWISRPHDRDVYMLFHVQYIWPNKEKVGTPECTFLSADGHWVDFDPGTHIEPCVSIPGQVLWMMEREQIIDGPVEKMLISKFQEWLTTLGAAGEGSSF